MEISELSLAEQLLIYNHRLTNIYAVQEHTSVKLTAMVTGKNSDVLISLSNGYSKTGESIILEDDGCKKLYDLLHLRYKLKCKRDFIVRTIENEEAESNEERI